MNRLFQNLWKHDLLANAVKVVLFGYLVFSCSPTSNKAANESGAPSATSTDTSTQTTDASQSSATPSAADATTTDTSGGTTMLNPLSLRVTVKKKVVLATPPILQDPSVTVPEVTYDKKTADYVQVLRCAKSYTIQNNLGQPIAQFQDSANADDDFLWAWTQAVNDNRNCKIVGLELNEPIFYDMGSDSGSYYYAINPCIIKEHSQTQKDGCSYHIQITDSVTYTSSLKDDYREKSQELSDAEGAMWSALNQLAFDGQLLVLRLNACENMVAHDANMKLLQTGFIELGLLVTAGALGFAVGGAMGALMGGQTAMGMGGQILQKKLDLIPPGDTCLQDVSAASASGGSNDAENNLLYQRAVAHSDEYEQKFQTRATIADIMSLTAQKDPNTPGSYDGAIAQAQTRINQILAEMKVMDNRTMTLDEAIAKANALGVDPQNPSTWTQASASGGLGSLLGGGSGAGGK